MSNFYFTPPTINGNRGIDETWRMWIRIAVQKAMRECWLEKRAYTKFQAD